MILFRLLVSAYATVKDYAFHNKFDDFLECLFHIFTSFGIDAES